MHGGRYVHASGLVAAVVYPLRMAVVLQGLIACLRPSGSPLVDKGLVIPISALGPKALRADIPQGQQNVSVRIAQFGVQRDVGHHALADKLRLDIGMQKLHLLVVGQLDG